MATNMPEVCILRNMVGSRSIFCVLADNTRSRIFSVREFLSIKNQLSRQPSADGCDILFIVVTNNVSRDRYLASPELKLWLADTASRRLMIYEEQPGDFYGLKNGIESSMLQAGQPRRSITAGNFPYVTAALGVLNIVYYLVLAFGGSLSSTSYMLSMGANYGPLVFQSFQIWRLVTSMFMHFSLSHLVSNMIYLGVAGYNLEKAVGHWRFALIYILSGIGGNMVSAAYYYMRGSNTISGGASGAIYGLIGGIALLTFLNFRQMKPAFIIRRVFILLIFIFYSSFASSTIDGAAHVGGFFFGILMTFIFIFGGKKHEKR